MGDFVRMSVIVGWTERTHTLNAKCRLKLRFFQKFVPRFIFVVMLGISMKRSRMVRVCKHSYRGGCLRSPYAVWNHGRQWTQHWLQSLQTRKVINRRLGVMITYHYGVISDLLWRESTDYPSTVHRCINNHLPSKLWSEVTNPFPNFSGCTVEV